MATTEEPAALTAMEPSQDTFNLQIISPSVGVPAPLIMNQLPVNTTIKQVKEKIREKIQSRPTDEAQRLIHRGRLLSRDTETMAEVFGQETIKTVDPQILHLVVRASTFDSPPAQANPQTTQPSSQQPPAAQGPPGQPPGIAIPNLPANANLPAIQLQTLHGLTQLHQHNFNLQQQLLPSMQRLQELQQQVNRLQATHIAQLHQQQHHGGLGHGHHHPVPSPADPAQQGAGTQRQLHTAMPFQNMVGQHQLERARSGRNTPQPGMPAAHNPGHAPLPDTTRTIRQEGIGPNGERWNMTYNETSSSVPSFHNPAPSTSQAQTARDIQNVLRSADAAAIQHWRQVAPARDANLAAGTAPVHRPTPSTQPATAPPPVASVRMRTPTPIARASSEQLRPAAEPYTPPAPASSPMVYLLSSPVGPRALIINGSDSYFTPRQPHHHYRSNVTPNANQPQVNGDIAAAGVGLPEYRNRAVRRAARQEDRRARHEVRDPALVNPHRAIPIVNHDNNNNLAAQALPHIWLLIRLAGFVWFFVSSDSSWWRWSAITGIAIVVFFYNTGIFNGVAEQVWGPIRRHLEGLLPLAAADPGPQAGNAAQQARLAAGAPAPVPAPVAGAEPGAEPGAVPQPQPNQAEPAANAAEPDPAEIANRLVNARQVNNGTWLMQQVRRTEHALILFFASLIPGVGERHIMARAQEENAREELRRRERERIENEENAARELAEAANAEENENQDGAGEGTVTGSAGVALEGASNNEVNQVPEEGAISQGQSQGEHRQEQPLIDV